MPSRSATLPQAPARTSIPPLVPVLLPLILASIGLNLLFAWLFPADDSQRPAPTPRFTDATTAVGIHFIHRHGSGDSPTTMGGGVTVFDANGDGAPDLFFINGAPWPWTDNAWQSPSSSALYLNDGKGHFTDVTAAAGLDVVMNGMAAISGDFDHDGDADLFVTCIGVNRLFRNNGDSTFTDITVQAGVGGGETDWSTGAAWLDVDQDGHLDLIVANYLRWPAEFGLAATINFARVGRSYGTPVGFIDLFPSVYRNRGDGTFEERRDHAGLRPTDPLTGFPRAKALALTPLDANQDGVIDVLFHFHTSAPALFLGRRDGGFAPWVSDETLRREGLSAGLAAAGSLPLAPVNSGNDLGPLLHTFLADTRASASTGETDLITKGGLVVLDSDLDGQREIFSAHGLMEADLARIETDAPFGSAPDLYWNDNHTWRSQPMPSLPQPFAARGMATADFDADGDLDLVIVQNQGPAIYLRNDRRNAPPWLRVSLLPRGHRGSVYGARVELHTPRGVTLRTLSPQLGYLAQSDESLTFGLGEDTRVRRLVIQWPSGQRQELRNVAINQHLVVTEP